MNISDCTVIPFHSFSSPGRPSRKALLKALRVAQSPVIVDLSGCRTLNHDDIDLLLQCAAQMTGRDAQVLFVAGSPVIRVLLEVTLLSSLVPVFNSLEEALVYPETAATAKMHRIDISEPTLQRWSA
jgi:anti-anti-sigma regulatory factor